MHQLIEFSLRHWELVIAFVVVLFLLIGFELHSQITGTPQLSPHQLTMLINREDAVLVDIRDSSSFAKGHIVDAINIPQADLGNQLKQLEKYKDKPLVIIYNTNQPFAKAISLLANNGFTQLNSLQGGIASWQNANLPLVKN